MENMSVYILAVIFIARFSELAANFYIPQESLMTLPELVSRTGRHDVQQHAVTTDDGYVLQVHRVRARSVEGGSRERGVAYLQHGIIASSEDYVRMGENRSLAYLLADAGYDVWLGNYRGNMYSSHKTMTKNQPEFWNFSFDEHGLLDLPATLDYILRVTGARRLHYVGHSMGCSGYVVMCNARPDLAQRVASFTGLAPAINLHPLLTPVARVLLGIRAPDILKMLRLDPVVFQQPIHQVILAVFCRGQPGFTDNCYRNIYNFIGQDFNEVDWKATPIIFAKLQPATIKQVTHFAQVMVKGALTPYDWGPEDNMQRYGRMSPKPYNLTANVAPTIFYYADNDVLIAPSNVRRVSRVLKKRNPIVIMKELPQKKFGHIDFTFSKNIHTELNYDVVKMIEKFTDKYNKEESNSIL